MTATAPASTPVSCRPRGSPPHTGLTKQAFSPEPAGQPHDRVAVHREHVRRSRWARALFSVLPIPAQPIMWFRGGYEDATVSTGSRARTSRSPGRASTGTRSTPRPSGTGSRPWTWSRSRSASRTGRRSQFAARRRLMLVAGDNDNYFPNAIYNSTIEVARAIRETAHGKAEFWLATGHSIHSERPTCSCRRSCTSWTTPTPVTPRTAPSSRRRPRRTTRWWTDEQPRPETMSRPAPSSCASCGASRCVPAVAPATARYGRRNGGADAADADAVPGRPCRPGDPGARPLPASQALYSEAIGWTVTNPHAAGAGATSAPVSCEVANLGPVASPAAMIEFYTGTDIGSGTSGTRRCSPAEVRPASSCWAAHRSPRRQERSPP